MTTKAEPEEPNYRSSRCFAGEDTKMPTPFTFQILGCQSWDVHDDNLDVEIEVGGTLRFAATFFTLQNIASLFEKNRATGECASGTYLWAANMIIVRELTTETIRHTIEDLLRTGELESVCLKLTNGCFESDLN
jgi:hypothetical protein